MGCCCTHLVAGEGLDDQPLLGIFLLRRVRGGCAGGRGREAEDGRHAQARWDKNRAGREDTQGRGCACQVHAASHGACAPGPHTLHAART